MDPTATDDTLHDALGRAYDLALSDPAVRAPTPPSNVTWLCGKCGRAQPSDGLTDHYNACDGRNPGRCTDVWPRCRLAHGHVGRHYPVKHHTQEYPP